MSRFKWPLLLVGLALACAAIAYGLKIRRPIPEPLPVEPAVEDRAESLHKYADETADSAFEFAQYCEARGGGFPAEQHLLKAIDLGRGYPKATERLRIAYLPEWLRAAGNDPEQLDEVVEKLQRARLYDEAETLARRVLELDAARPHARNALHLGPPDMDAALLDFPLYLKVRGVQTEELSARKIEVLRQKWLALQVSRISDQKLIELDTAPETPFLLMMEKSNSYNAELVLSAIRDACVAFCRIFSAEFGEQFDAAMLARTEVCPLYVFSTKGRYAQACDVPDWYGGHFEPRSGRISIYKDTAELYETVFHLLTHAVIHQAWLRYGEPLGKRSDTEMPWFSEGLSTYMERFKHDSHGDFVLGEVSPLYAPFMKKLIADGKAAPLRDFLGLTWKAYLNKIEDREFNERTTAQAWALVYFLNKYEKGRYRAKFREYLLLEVAGKGGLESAKTCFGDLDALDGEFTAYWKNLR